MQYKIPVQIENEDTIFLGLSIRQLGIIMIGTGIGYSIYKKLEPAVGTQIAIVPLILFAGIAIIVALFKNSEMTFLPFMLNLIRLNLNVGTRVWHKGSDGFSSFADIGYVASYSMAKKKATAKGGTSEVLETVQDQLSKL
jgi:hypothetical protein